MTETQQQADAVLVSPTLLQLLELGRQARHTATGPELQFLLVNRTHALCPYLLAAYWVEQEGVVLQSGVSRVDANAPFIQWLSGVCAGLSAQSSPVRVAYDLLSAEDRAQWGEYLPASALWLPVTGEVGGRSGLLLCRQEPWEDADIALLQEWLDIWGHAWKKLHAPSMQGELRKLLAWLGGFVPTASGWRDDVAHVRRGMHHVVGQGALNPSRWPVLLAQAIRAFLAWLFWPLQTLISQGPSALAKALGERAQAVWRDKARRVRWMVVALMILPVRLTVLAPAELVPAHPAMIRVPIDGVVDEFFVAPNQVVAEGQPLFRLDLTTLTSRLNVAQQEIQIAASEYRQGSLQSLTDARSRTQLTAQEARTAERKLEVDYLKELLAKAQIKSPRPGVVLFDDPSEWIGKPVVAGEKVMMVASEGDVEIEAWLALGDALELPADAPVTMYLNAAPLRPVSGLVRYEGHEAIQRPDGSYAYRLRARLAPGQEAPRVGLRGTAKVSGAFVPLAYWILRKPLGSLRQLLGI